jgi:sugar-specific transcriptional regulator TrmB
MNVNKLKSALLTLGFSEHESAVYLELANIGSTGTGTLIKNTELHRNVVYTALERLVKRKYVLESQEKGKKRFVLADPSIIEQEFTKKAEVASNVAEGLSKIVALPAQEITVYKGNEAYLTLLSSLIRELPRGGASYILGTGGEEFMEQTMRKIWRRYHKVARDQGIKIKMISYESHRNMLKKDLKGQEMYEIRYLPDDIENPAGVRVYPEAGVMLNVIYSTEEQTVTAIRIKSDDLVQGQLNLFENLWRMAKP